MSKRGFTLFEVMLALLLLSVGIAAGLQISVAALRLGSQSHYTLLAAKGVQEYYIEYLRSLTFTHADLTLGLHTTPIPPSLSRLPTPNSAKYWVDTVLEDPAASNLKRVTIQVTWPDPGGGGTRSSVISTLITRDGLTNPSP